MSREYKARHFFALYFSTIALFVIPFVLSMQDILRQYYWLPWFIWPLLIIIAVFFVLIAMPHVRNNLGSIEVPNKYSPKHFLLLLWLSFQTFFLSIGLHGAIYALGIVLFGEGFWGEGDEAVFFIIALFVVPVGSVVGAVGRLWNWFVVQPINEMRNRGIQLPVTWGYFAPFVTYAWLWKFGKGIEAITDRRIRAAGVFASVFFLGVIGFLIIRYTIHRRLEKIFEVTPV